jgi:hypothetical protein
MAKGILIAAMDFSNVAEDEFNDWYDTEHIPERQRVPGFLVCQRWIGADNPKQSVATYDLESLAVLEGPGYRAIGGENLSPWSKRVTARVQRLVRFEGDQILPGDQAAPENAGGLLLVGMTPAPAVETAFNAWYDTEHVPALARVPEVRSPLPSCLTRSGRRRGMEGGERVDADARAHPAADQRPPPFGLPQLPPRIIAG